MQLNKSHSTKLIVASSVTLLLTLQGCGSQYFNRDMGPNQILGEPRPSEAPPARYGNQESYSVNGRTYQVLPTTEGYQEIGTASWYGREFHGKPTSSMEPFDMYAITAAHPTLPIPTFVRVTNLSNNASSIVRVNDRGPFTPDRIIDLSYGAAQRLGFADNGTAQVRVEAVPPFQVRWRGPNAAAQYTSAAGSPFTQGQTGQFPQQQQVQPQTKPKLSFFQKLRGIASSQPEPDATYSQSQQMSYVPPRNSSYPQSQNLSYPPQPAMPYSPPPPNHATHSADPLFGLVPKQSSSSQYPHYQGSHQAYSTQPLPPPQQYPSQSYGTEYGTGHPLPPTNQGYGAAYNAAYMEGEQSGRMVYLQAGAYRDSSSAQQALAQLQQWLHQRNIDENVHLVYKDGYQKLHLGPVVDFRRAEQLEQNLLASPWGKPIWIEVNANR